MTEGQKDGGHEARDRMLERQRIGMVCEKKGTIKKMRIETI